MVQLQYGCDLYTSSVLSYLSHPAEPVPSEGSHCNPLQVRYCPHLTAVWPTETVPVQYLRVTDVDNARKIDEKLYCDLIRNLLGHIPIFGEHLKLYIRLGVRNAGLSRRAHVATAFTASLHHRITGRPGFIDDLSDLFQQNLFRDDDELFSWLGHVG